jgi:hypothetical protein
MHAASLARFDPRHPPLALPPPMQAEAYAEAMNQAIADAVAAEAQRDAAVARVAELTRPPVCDNAGHPIAEMIYARLLQDFPGIARNEHKAIHIRLEMNSARTDLDGESMESIRAYCEDVESIFFIEANEGAAILRQAIEDDGLNASTPRKLLAGPQTYIFDDIEYWSNPNVNPNDDDFIGLYVLWKDANGEQYSIPFGF